MRFPAVDEKHVYCVQPNNVFGYIGVMYIPHRITQQLF
jgi:hypothetical protein